MAKVQAQKEITIDGDKYIVQLYGPTYGFVLYSKLLRLLGEPIVKLIGIVKGKDLNAMEDLLSLDLGDLNIDAAGEALQSLFSKLKDDELPELLKAILSQTFFVPSLEPVVDTFETAFAGRYLHVFKLAAKTLGVQYADFLSGLVKRTNAVKGGAASGPKAMEEKARA